MTVDTTTLDLCECRHPRYEHQWQFWPEDVTYGQCWHGGHGIDGEGDCTCSGFELAETHVPLPAPTDLIEHGTRWQRLNPGAGHVHRYDRGHIECNRTPACTADPVPAAVVTAAKAAFSPEDMMAWPEMQAIVAAMGIQIAPGVEPFPDNPAAQAGAAIWSAAIERVNAHLCWCHHRRDEHDTTPTGKQDACTYGRYSRDGNTCPCTEYELADTPADLIENLCDVVDAFFVRNQDDRDLIRRARRWLTTHDEGARGD